MRRGLGFHARRSPGVFNPASLFLGGTVNGAWFDPSDSTTLFSDRAGTTPCGTPGGGSVVPVGLMLDKSQNGVGTNGAKRVNLLTYSEQFDNAAWQITAIGSTNPVITANQGIAPNGTNTADRIDFGAITNATDTSRLFQSFTSVATAYVGSVYLKAFSASDVGKKIFVWLFDTAGRDTQTVTLTDSWQRISSTSTLTAGTSFITLQTAGSSVVAGGGAQAATSALVWGADLRLASEAATLPTYQRITDTWYATEAGNHAIAANDTTARPELRARVNLLTYSEDFSNPIWLVGTIGAGNPTKGTTTTTKPDGTSGTVDTLTYPAVSGGQVSHAYQVTNAAYVNVSMVASVWMRVASGTGTVYINLEDGTTGPSGGNFVAGTALSLTTTWQRFSLTGTRTTSSGNLAMMIGFDTRAAAGQTNAGSLTVQIWGADIRPANIGTAMPAYQRISDANTYDAVGFPRYLVANGTSSAMSTPGNVNLSGTDKVTVFAGVRKLSDAARGMLLELSAVATNPGAFYVAAPDTNGTANYGMYLDPGAAYQPTTYTAPISNVISVAFNRAGATLADRVIPRINGIVNQTNPSTATPTGNFGTYPLFIGARNNSSLFLNGNIYGLTVVGSALSAGQITQMEQWLAGKTGISI